MLPAADYPPCYLVVLDPRATTHQKIEALDDLLEDLQRQRNVIQALKTPLVDACYRDIDEYCATHRATYTARPT
jgi:hypothetical protein